MVSASGQFGFKVVAVADVGLVHQAAEGGNVVGDEGVSGGDGAGVFGDDVAGALEGVGWDFVTPGGEVFDGGVAEELDLGPVGGKNTTGLFDLSATVGVIATGDGVLGPWCWR